MNASDALKASLAPVSRSLNAAAAQKLLDLRPPIVMQERVDELATLCNEGAASGEELAEYDALINAANLIAILQSQLLYICNHRGFRDATIGNHLMSL